MTVGIYIRVSTQEQANEGYSISAQKERLTAYCTAQGWQDYKFYVDEGVSAKDTNRPQLKMMMDHVQEGKINTILVYRLDRFTRRVKDLYTLLDTLKKHKCAFRSATEPYDTSSAMGKMFIGLVALLAEWETENLSERVKMALEKKVSGGERVGAVPYGFDLADDETLVKNEKAAVVLDIIEKVKSGMSVNAIADYLTQTNNDKQTWRPNTIFRLLKNPALYGATRWVDKVYENTHTGIITKLDFIKLQQMLDDRALHRLREVESTYLFQGVLSCPCCEKILSVNRYMRKRKDGTGYQSALYKCQNCWREGREMISVGEHRILKALYDFMENIELKYLEPIEEDKDERSLLLDQLQVIEKKREKYQRAWGSDKMTDKEFNKLMDETRETYDDLKEKIEHFQLPVKIDIKAIDAIVSKFNINFFTLNQEEKRAFVSTFIRRIDFEVIPQPPKRPDKAKKGKGLVRINHVMFY